MSVEAKDGPRRILMTADAVGGVWQYAVDLSAALAHAGVEVLLATLGPAPSSEQLRRIEAVRGVRVLHGDYSLEWMEKPWRDVDASGKWLLSLQQSFSADLIHLNGFSHAALPWERPVVCVGHSCVRSWWLAVHGTPPGPEWAEYTRRVRAGLDVCSKVVTPSAAMARSLTEEYDVEAAKISVIHNSTRIRESDGKGKEAFILAAGRMWDRAKNVGLLVEISSRLDWPLRVAGASDLSLGADSPHMLGVLSQERVFEQMRCASIFAHAALYEPFGLSILEAARSRCSLVLSNISSLRELWDGAAVFLDPRDPELWAFELNQLGRDFPGRRRLGDLAARRARRYASEAMLDAYVSLYASLLSGQFQKGVAA